MAGPVLGWWLSAGKFDRRFDRFGFPKGWLDLPVCGVWVVNADGLITLWRDYFDMNTYMSRLTELTS